MNFKRITGIAAAAMLGLTASAASAQGGYVALSAFDWSVDHTSGPSELESTGVRATGGYMFSDLFGIEAHIASGGTDDLQYPGGLNAPEKAEAELNKVLSGFAKLNLPLPFLRANVFGLAGYSYGRIDILAETTTDTISQNSFSYGAGADIALSDRLYLTADYIDYISRTGVSASAASVGLRLLFGQ